MEVLKVESITITPDSLDQAIKALEEAIEKHTEIKGHLEQVLALQSGTAASGRVVRVGGRGRRPRGEMTLRQAILAVLSKVKGPLKPIELRDRVLKSGYKTTATPQSIYTAVFNTARKEPSITKTGEGFQLKAKAGARKKKVARGRKGPRVTTPRRRGRPPKVSKKTTKKKTKK